MLVRTMEPKEIYNAIAVDKPKLYLKAELLKEKYKKYFKKSKRFPIWRHEEYVHQESNNKYLVSFYVPSKQSIDSPLIDYISIMEEGTDHLVIKTGYWDYHRPGSPIVDKSRYIIYFSPHFFQRYKQRVWSDSTITYHELLCRYFSRNQDVVPVKMSEQINTNFEDYGEGSEYAFMTLEGVCFGESYSVGDNGTIGNKDSDYMDVLALKTFVSFNMLSDTQKEALRKGIKDYRQHQSEFLQTVFNDRLIASQLHGV